jgi:hypothetical protein
METEYSGKSPQSLVILVHGTGAGDLADRGSKWWQAGSEFWTVLTASVGPAAVVDRPFHWSGQNSESERKKAGRALLAHLFELESAGISYHIIGHSHGGSVVWHALVDSVRVNRRLFGLKSWATVGTPFLKFEPLRPHLCRWLALGILAALGAWLLSLAPFREWVLAISSLHESGGYLSLAFVGGFFAAISVLTVWALARVLVPIILCALTARERRAETRAAAWYGDRWLALWHPLDEPINSLAGTVGEAPQIAPRVAQDGIFGVVPLAGPIVNRLLARAADQFAWRLITSRIQGADRRAYTLVNVGRAPLVLQPGFEPIAPGLASEMTGAADAKSIESVKCLSGNILNRMNRL